MLSRTEYFKDLLADCLEATRNFELDPADEAAIVAALIKSDSDNGLRKALLQVQALLTNPQYKQI
jgi:hypothetical protein